jgi:hypothetical protein
VWDSVASWWGGVELWLTQLPFAAQFALVMAVLVPLCLGIVAGVDRIVDALALRVRWRPTEEPDPAARPRGAGGQSR